MCDGAAAAAGHPMPRCGCASVVVLPTTLPTSSPTHGASARKDDVLPERVWRSCANLPSRSAADSRSVASKPGALRVELPQPLWQRTTSIGTVSARQDIGQHSRSSASGPVFGCAFTSRCGSLWGARATRADQQCVSVHARASYIVCATCANEFRVRPTGHCHPYDRAASRLGHIRSLGRWACEPARL